MKKLQIHLLLMLVFCACSSDEQSLSTDTMSQPTLVNDNEPEDTDSDVDATTYADINFTNWKVTLPIDENNNGSPDEYQPSQLVNFGYQTLAPVMPYMYDDESDASLMFYTFPDISTSNSSFSRTELRELINPDSSSDNWTLLEGGEMVGRLKVTSVSENTQSSDDYHKVIVMQIHGIISPEDMSVHGFSSNNGPPLIKIYWKDGYVWSHKKSLIDEATSGDDLLETSNNTWADIKVNLGYVGNDAFDFRITASDAKIEVQLNTNTPHIYEDISLDKWPYQNYFKAGNYLTTTDADAFSYVKYYNLNVTH
ncbi:MULTISPECIES: polysaccharide lyase family 7 protein [Olleya]|uniref:polysaccharide lyase family 7 protein n=1 Tax=Olleya TaxID=336276 RepID=UPI000C33E900|nr:MULTISPECIES: polysaccharide lyase family 7 protein [Olleya]PKG50610.1 polysaccharide lyase family 7 protein [Olleya sp. 1-3]